MRQPWLYVVAGAIVSSASIGNSFEHHTPLPLPRDSETIRPPKPTRDVHAPPNSSSSSRRRRRTADPVEAGRHSTLIEAERADTERFNHRDTQEQPHIIKKQKRKGAEVLWTDSYEVETKYTKNPSTSPFTRPLVVYNRIAKTGSTSLMEEMLSVAKNSRGQNRFEMYSYRLSIGTKKGLFSLASFSAEHAMDEGVMAVCKHLAELARRPYPGVWAFHVEWFDVQAVCPEEWGEGTKARNAASAEAVLGNSSSSSSKGRELQHRELNAAKTGLQVWPDEIVWINQLRNPATRWLSSIAYEQDCICKPKKTRPGWCARRAKFHGKFLSWHCTLSLEQVLEHRLGIREKLPAGGPPEGSFRNTRPPDDCKMTEYLLGKGCCDTLGLNGTTILDQAVTAKIQTIVTERFAWIGILEEPEASLRTLRHALPKYFDDTFNSIYGGIKRVHAGDASNRKDKDKLSNDMLDLLSAALPVDFAVYTIVRNNLLAKDLELKPNDSFPDRGKKLVKELYDDLKF